jgi:hypothetical protein
MSGFMTMTAAANLNDGKYIKESIDLLPLRLTNASAASRTSAIHI